MRLFIVTRAAWILTLAFFASDRLAAPPSGPTRDELRRALQRAGQFYALTVANQGGYHATYAADLSYGRSSKNGEGSTQISTAGAGTPAVGMAFLVAYEATGDQFFRDAARAAAHALVQGQLCSGGWDYTIELDPAKRQQYAYRADGQCGGYGAKRHNRTNLDNNATAGALRLLMRVDQALGFKDEPIHESARYALESLLKAQYPNGAWPQRYDQFPNPALYPVQPAAFPDSWPREWPGEIYYSHYTFNDECITSMMDVLLEAARIYGEPRYRAAAEKAGQFILLAQMPDPQPAWAQQYDAEMHPAWARNFEPPGLAGRESVEIMKALLMLYQETGSKRYLAPIPRALDYLDRSAFMQDGKRVIARFFELRTNQPLYVTQGSILISYAHRSKLAAMDLPEDSPVLIKGLLGGPIDGYKLSYIPKNAARHYSYTMDAGALQNVREEYERVLKTAPEALKRPAKLRSLSPGYSPPWAMVPTPPPPKAARRIISSLDERGAWVQPGYMEAPGRILRLNPARDLVIVLDGTEHTLPPGRDLEVYERVPPFRLIISSGTFVSNILSLSQYLEAID